MACPLQHVNATAAPRPAGVAPKPWPGSVWQAPLLAVCLAALAFAFSGPASFANSLQIAQLEAEDGAGDGAATPEASGNSEQNADDAPTLPDGNSVGQTEEQNLEQTGEPTFEQAPIPEVITDLNEIPFPTRKMRELILEAAREGDVEKLRPYLGFGDDVTMLALDGVAADPIEFLKSQLGDSEGHEILAIMTEILEVPPVRLQDPGGGDEIYVWPYFYTYPFDKMTPRQRVEMFRIITYGDYEDMLQFGTYNFFRLGISPEGRWLFFVAGD